MKTEKCYMISLLKRMIGGTNPPYSVKQSLNAYCLHQKLPRVYWSHDATVIWIFCADRVGETRKTWRDAEMVIVSVCMIRRLWKIRSRVCIKRGNIAIVLWKGFCTKGTMIVTIIIWGWVRSKIMCRIWSMMMMCVVGVMVDEFLLILMIYPKLCIFTHPSQSSQHFKTVYIAAYGDLLQLSLYDHGPYSLQAVQGASNLAFTSGAIHGHAKLNSLLLLRTIFPNKLRYCFKIHKREALGTFHFKQFPIWEKEPITPSFSRLWYRARNNERNRLFFRFRKVPHIFLSKLSLSLPKHQNT